jgi:hypothetical protein
MVTRYMPFGSRVLVSRPSVPCLGRPSKKRGTWSRYGVEMIGTHDDLHESEIYTRLAFISATSKGMARSRLLL